jgi:hypothetical protein
MKVTIELECPFCGNAHSVEVKEDDYFDWQFGGVLAQNAFPYLNPTERDQLISQVCPKSQEKIFGE